MMDHYVFYKDNSEPFKVLKEWGFSAQIMNRGGVVFEVSSNDLVDGYTVAKQSAEEAEARAADLAESVTTLRAEVKELIEWRYSGAKEIEALTAERDDQARRIEAAQKVIERCAAYIGSIDYGQNTKSYMMCEAWLASTAPAPQAEQAPE